MIRELAVKHKAHKMDDGCDYSDAYETHFSLIRDYPLRILEIGVQGGGSLRLWEDYFPNARITGLDINPNCAAHASARSTVIIGSQEDKEILYKLAEASWDIIIDDGGHTMKQQKRSFKALYDAVAPGGWYIIEDLHTSYWPKFGGKFGDNDTMIGTLKSCIDHLHWQHWKKSKRAEPFRIKADATHFDLTIESMHFYDSICFMHKKASV